MKFERVGRVILGAALILCLPAGAQEKGNWRASNSTAKAITGDLALSDERISINFAGFVIARVRSLQPAEWSAAFDAEGETGGSGSLYRVSIPASAKFLHKNSLCGAEDTHWMATYVAGRSLHVAFFSSEAVPVFTLEAIANSTDLCGTFTYTR